MLLIKLPVFFSVSVKSMFNTLKNLLQPRRRTIAMATVDSVTADLTTCQICWETFDNPKSLPCLHAFCLKCLQACFHYWRPGYEVPCPTCRTKFKIPVDGLGGLQHNFIIQRLVDVRKAKELTITTEQQPGRS